MRRLGPPRRPGQSRLVPDLVQELTHKLATQRRDSERRRQRADRIRRLIRGEDLSMVFQPIVDLGDGRVVAMEALARIATPPTRPPNWWFAEAGAMGLDVELELTAVRAALAGLERLPPHVDLSVNAPLKPLCGPGVRGPLPAGE